jgi:hypothetical protein
MERIFAYVQRGDFSFLHRREYELSRMQENVELGVYSALAFFVPFFMAQPQMFVGTIVNAALVLAAFNLRGKKLLPIIMLPSIGVLSAGVLFGNFTPALVYMIPMIWLGNAILVFGIKEFVLHRKMHRLAGLGIGAIAKTVFLFMAAYAMISFGILPTVMLAAMGMLQLYTAVLGGVFAIALQHVKKGIF